jgi:hypothetical protein
MPEHAIDARLTGLLADMNALGGYPMSLVCTDQGLLLASAGETLRSEITAGLTSLFDDIVARAARDLSLAQVDELTLSDAVAGRTIIRPLTHAGGQVRLFLVVQVPPGRSWRRNTNLVVRKLLAILRPWLSSKETTP